MAKCRNGGKVMEYKLVEDVSVGKLSDRINEELENGFVLYGNPFYSPYNTGDESKPFYCQAVVKI